MIEKASYEFDEVHLFYLKKSISFNYLFNIKVETMLKDAEGLCGEYVWGVYDLLVLPPTFPFGG